MQSKNLIFAVSLLFSAALFCQAPLRQKSFRHLKLKKLWTTEKGLITPESVLFDQKREVIYVANINGGPTVKNGNGFIAKLAPDGKFINLNWIEGLNAPKGMGVFGEKLYVTDIDLVVEIDIDKGVIVNRYEAENAKFLNDISIDSLGVVYISDMLTNHIYRLKNGRLKVWLESPLLESPNGLWVEGRKLLIGVNGSVLQAGRADKKVSVYMENTGSIDGLVADGRGGYLISDWQGHVYLISPGKEKLLLLDTTADKMNAADMEYVINKKMLLVPTFFDNRVIAYYLDL